MENRVRTVFSKEHLKILEKYFKRNPYLDNATKEHLSKLLGFSSYQVKVWFQNRRTRRKKCGNKDAKATENAGPSTSGRHTNNETLATIHSRRHNCRGTCCRSSRSAPSSKNSIDLPTVANAGNPPRRTSPFRLLEPNSSSFNASIPNQSLIQGRASATTPYPADRFPTCPSLWNHNVGNHRQRTHGYQEPDCLPSSSPRILQFHHSSYIEAPYIATPPVANSDARYGCDTHQNQRVFPALSSGNSRTETASMRRAKEFSLMRRSNVGNNENFEHQAPSNRRKRIISGALHSNANCLYQQENSSSHHIYEREESDSGTVWMSSGPNALKCEKSRPCFIGNASTHQENPNKTQLGNTVKTEFPSTSYNQANFSYQSQTAASNMLQNFEHERDYFPERNPVPLNVNFPGYSINEASSYPTNLDYSSAIPDDQKNKNLSSFSADKRGFGSCSELSELSEDENNHDRDFDKNPSWEEIFSAPLRTLEDTTDIEYSGKSTNTSHFS